MFKFQTINNLNQISLTGARAIALLGLLIVAPRSIDEIREILLNNGLLEKTNSNDILRIDINTLKLMGCKILRASKRTNYKYIMEKHPFSLKMTLEEVKIIKKLYKECIQQSDIEGLIEYDVFFNKIASFVFDNEVREALLGISILKYYNLILLKELLSISRQKLTIQLLYYTPNRQSESIKEIAVQKLIVQNQKIYVCGYDVNKKMQVILNLKRIKSILARKLKKDNPVLKSSKIKFILTDYYHGMLDEGETLCEITESGCIIEGEYYNEFVAMQRILSFGSKCTVIEPQDFKNKVIEKLKEMRNIYEQ